MANRRRKRTNYKDGSGSARTAPVRRGPTRNSKGQLKAQTNQTLADVKRNDKINGTADSKSKFNNKEYKTIGGDFKNSAELNAWLEEHPEEKAKVKAGGTGVNDHASRAKDIAASLNAT